MARPKADEGKGREAFVAAAIENFTARGFHGTTMRDIARSAGVSVASIYHHFESKQAILRELMTGTMNELLASTRSAVDALGSEAPAAERLDALVDVWIDFHTSRQAEALVGASELRSLDDGGRAAVVALRDEQEALFRTIVDDGVRTGAFATPYPREAARAIIEMGYSVASWYRLGGELTPAEMSVRYRELARGTVRAAPSSG